MCGICGFVHYKNVTENVLADMTSVIKYRGPDDTGYYMDAMRSGAQIGFGHVRLSILDISASGHQPMFNPDGSIVVTYNGEIYNYQELRDSLIRLGYSFKSNCDTEVLLYAYQEWGLDCISKLNGMFAIAIYDKRKSGDEKVFLIRDRMGVKPLYYYFDGKNLCFASELKSIMKYPFFQREIDENSLGLFLAYRYITGPGTIFKNTFKVNPGSIVCWSNGSITEQTYWSVQSVLETNNRFIGTYEEAQNKLWELLLDATAKRMISDVPLGAFLSGGYDSSLIVSLMCELSSQKVKTFTISFDEKEYDESVYASEVAKCLGTEHYCWNLSMAEGKKLIQEIPEFFDEPMADMSQIATLLLSKMTKQQVTVALSGDAGDELFCGYNWYTLFDRYRNLSKIISCAKKVCPHPERITSNRKLIKLFNMDTPENIINADFNSYWAEYRGIVKKYPNNEKYNMAALSMKPQHQSMICDMQTFLPDDILMKVDRASMAYSLETRAPLLDYRIVEFALNLPLDFKYKQGQKKRILKDLAYRRVNKSLLDRPKHGFVVPVTKWMQQDFSGLTQGYLEEDFIKKQGIFNWRMVEKMRKNFERNDPAEQINLWTLLVFQMWYAKYL